MNERATLGIGLGLVLTTAVISGVSTFVNSYAIGGTSSDPFVTVRNLIVAGLLVPLVGALAIARPSKRPLGARDWAGLAVIGVVGGAIPFLLFFHGLELATAAHAATSASFLYRTLFLFATVFAVVFLRERFRWGVVVGAALLLGGCYLLLSLTSVVWTDGSLYVLAATVLWAAEYTLSKRLLTTIRSTTVALARMGIGGGVLAGYLAVTAQWAAVGRFSGTNWEWVVISALLLTAFVVTWYAGLARVDLSLATAALVLGYPVTWLLSVAVRGSAVLWDPAVGSVCVALGVVVVLGYARLRELAGGRPGRTVVAAPPVG